MNLCCCHCCREFRQDYNQTHFVRNDAFKKAAENVQGDTRKIFIEFLERSCTAEFSGFLLYKELGRRLKKTNPVVAEIFSLMVRGCSMLCFLTCSGSGCVSLSQVTGRLFCLSSPHM